MKLPTYKELGGVKSARSGRNIASWDTSAVGRGMERSGRSTAAAASNVASGLRSIGAGLEGISQGAQVRADQIDDNQKKADRFETQRKFLEFSSQQQKAYDSALETVEPGAIGFEQQIQAAYKEQADQFARSIPEHLRGQYDSKLFSVEDSLISKARTFESTERKRHYGGIVDDGLTEISNNLYANPGSFDENLAAGNEFIENIPDDQFSRIEKDQMKEQWREKAQLAALNGVSPEERIRLLGGASSSEEGGPTAGSAQKMTRGIRGDIRSTISSAAEKYGIDPHAMLVIAHLESRGNPKAKNERSSAGGLFQFIDSTAKLYGLSDRYDPVQASDAAARLARDNAQILRGVLGREPTTGELYLAHQQGAGGASKLLSNPGELAVNVVGSAEVRLNGGHAEMTAGEFAGLWLKKAGDVNIPEGSFGSFDPDKADPRFSDMDYTVASKMISDAQVEIGKNQKAEAAAAADIAKQAALAAKEAATAATDAYNLQIELDPSRVTVDEVLEDDRIDNGVKATLIAKLKKANEEAIDKATAVQRAVSGNNLYNGLDKDDRTSANLAFEEMTKNTDDPNYFRMYGESFAGKGAVPKGYSDRIKIGMNSQSPANVADAANMAYRLVENYPQAVNTSMTKADQDALKDAATTYSFLKHNMGLSDQEIGQRLIDRNDPEKMAQREALLKTDTIKDHIDDINPDYVADQISIGSGRVFDFSLGVDPAGALAITNEWKRMFKENLGATGNLEEARTLTNSQFSRSYGPSTLSNAGEDTITYLPATTTYPAAPDGTHDYLVEQAIQALAEDGVNTNRVYFEHAIDNGINLTEESFRQGRPVEYQIYYEDENGDRQAHPFPFFGDAKTIAAAQKAQAAADTAEQIERSRSINRRGREQEVERTNVIEGFGKQEKSVFQEMDDAVEEFKGLPPKEAPSAGGGSFTKESF